jgi:hypothetical protein
MHHLNVAIKDMKNELHRRLNNMENNQKKQIDSISTFLRKSNNNLPDLKGNSVKKFINRRLISRYLDEGEKRLDELLQFKSKYASDDENYNYKNNN